MRDYRKKTLSNLSLAQSLSFTKESLFQTAKQSFQNLAINCLEYAKFFYAKNLSKAIHCENPEIAQNLYNEGKGIIFFCGHQANWEALFLDGTSRMKGIAIGRPIKNKYLYRWIVSIREKFGGRIIEPRNALREGIRALRKGIFVGIVGDQGKTDSSYSFPFFGRRAWTATAPAFLSYRTNSPIIFAQTRREKNGYKIHYSDPIWPDKSKPIEEEVVSVMDKLSTLLQESVRCFPAEYLWQHKRWKQPSFHNIRSGFSYDCICIILPPNSSKILPHLSTLREIYSLHFLILIAPDSFKNQPLIEADEVIYYQTLQETLREDYRFKLIFNFTDYSPIESHYKKLSAFKVLNLSLLEKLAAPFLPPNQQGNLSEIFKRALCRPGTMWQPHGN